LFVKSVSLGLIFSLGAAGVAAPLMIIGAVAMGVIYFANLKHP
jgi:hypothetical protein